MKNDNSYKIAGPWKRILSFLADFFLLFILASGLYSVAIYPLMQKFPAYHHALIEQQTHLEKCRQMYYDGKLLESNIEPESYIEKAIKNKLADDNNDIFIHYYVTYLPTIHKDGVSFSYDSTYVNKNVYQYENQGDIVLYDLNEDLSNPLLINSVAKEMLNKYYNNDITKENEVYHTKIVEQYKNGLMNAEKILISSDEFINDYSIVQKNNTVLYLHVSISSIITYTVLFILLYIVAPLVFKNGQTIGKKVLKIGLYHDTNTPIRKNILILRAIMQYITYYFVVILIPLWQVGITVINLPLLVFPTFTINLFLLCFASLVLAAISLITMALTTNKQALHDKVTRVYAYRMDVELEEENAIKNEEFKEKSDE